MTTEAQDWIAAYIASGYTTATPCIDGCGHTDAEHAQLIAHLQMAAWLDGHGIEYGYPSVMAGAVARDWDDAIGPKCSVCRFDPPALASTRCDTCEAEERAAIDADWSEVMREQNAAYQS